MIRNKKLNDYVSILSNKYGLQLWMHLFPTRKYQPKLG